MNLITCVFFSSLEFVGRGKRGRTTNAGLRKILESRKGLLDIAFDQQQGTYRPVGSNAKYFASLVGTIVERLPQNTAGWLFIPQSARDMVLVEVGVKFLFVQLSVVNFYIILHIIC